MSQEEPVPESYSQHVRCALSSGNPYSEASTSSAEDKRGCISENSEKVFWTSPSFLRKLKGCCSFVDSEITSQQFLSSLFLFLFNYGNL
ncbi:hypothetical protein NPIL_616811 [Nephila pilipes]|uniref:Uncharacterized protein n=1 Tax=Nephila pilipes TaxID=299642 RepID=A0A8X6P9F6_NEPPI|nr:hypothetical protein NPIL_616811 [Nephila pilipes]